MLDRDLAEAQNRIRERARRALHEPRFLQQTLIEAADVDYGTVQNWKRERKLGFAPRFPADFRARPVYSVADVLRARVARELVGQGVQVKRIPPIAALIERHLERRLSSVTNALDDGAGDDRFLVLVREGDGVRVVGEFHGALPADMPPVALVIRPDRLIDETLERLGLPLRAVKSSGAT
jgi:hypothetical protein